jgi:hypothetical protein
MSGTAVTEADSKSVLMPGVDRAGLVFVHVNTRGTSVGAIGAVGVIAKEYVCD